MFIQSVFVLENQFSNIPGNYGNLETLDGHPYNNNFCNYFRFMEVCIRNLNLGRNLEYQKVRYDLKKDSFHSSKSTYKYYQNIH